MKKRSLTLSFLLLASLFSFSQSIGIGTTTPSASAALDISNDTKGILIPRMGTAAINAIPNPANGLLVYDSMTNRLMVNMGRPATPNWQTIASNNAWNLGGNYNTNVVTQFVGTNDNHPLRFRVNGILAGEISPATKNVFFGLRAGETNTTAYSNIAIGPDALKYNTVRSNLIAIGDSALFNNGTGALVTEAFGNTAVGSKALFTNTRGSSNTATGLYSLYSNTTGNSNSAFGVSSLFFNTTGSFNTASGQESLLSNFTGNSNTAIGHQSLYNNNGSFNTAVGTGAMKFNVTGSNNTATGYLALTTNIEGSNNTAMGFNALKANTIGNNNTAMGYQALASNSSGGLNTAVGRNSIYNNTTGTFNTAVGNSALESNTSGSGNTAIGEQALFVNTGTTGSNNTAVGVQTLHATPSSQNNTAVGYFAGNLVNLGYNNTFIGANADANFAGIFNSVAIGESSKVTASNQVRLGNGATTSIGGYVGYSNISDGRYKKNIQEDVKGIDFIMKLRPVTYHLDISGLNKKLNVSEKDEVTKKAIAEKEKTLFSGFVAQEVEKAAKETGYDFSGVDKPQNENDLYSLRYAEFVVPLVKAMQEQQAMINDLKKQNTELQKINAAQKNINEDLLKRIGNLESVIRSKK